MKRRSQGTANTPTTFQPLEHDQAVNAAVRSPFAQRLSCAIEFKEMVSARVEALFAFSRPAAVIRGVRAVIVDAFDCVTWRRSRPHVAVERGEIVVPRRAHANASAAVVGVRWIVAALFHADPNLVLRGFAHAVRAAACARRFVLQATAGLRHAARHVLQIQFAPRTAIAAAFNVPLRLVPARRRDFSKNCPPPNAAAKPFRDRAAYRHNWSHYSAFSQTGAL